MAGYKPGRSTSCWARLNWWTFMFRSDTSVFICICIKFVLKMYLYLYFLNFYYSQNCKFTLKTMSAIMNISQIQSIHSSSSTYSGSGYGDNSQLPSHFLQLIRETLRHPRPITRCNLTSVSWVCAEQKSIIKELLHLPQLLSQIISKENAWTKEQSSQFQRFRLWPK